jgi:hypothetical protein
MEREYQHQHLSAIIDHFKPLAFTICPFALILRIGFAASKICKYPNFSASEIIVCCCRLCVNLVVIYACHISSRFEKQRGEIGYLIVWGYRAIILALIAEEIGLEQDQSEITRLVFILAYFFVIGPLVTPTYEEHLCMLLSIACSKPIAFLLTGSYCPLATSGCSNTFDWSSHLQQAAVLCASAGTNFVGHSDRRHIWLSSPRIHPSTRDETEQEDSYPSPPPSDLDTDALNVAAVIAGWELLTAAEQATCHSEWRTEAAEIRRRAAGTVGVVAAEWQCDGHVLGAGPCGYVLRAVDADGRFLALKQVTSL